MAFAWKRCRRASRERAAEETGGLSGVSAGWDRGTSRDAPTEGGVGASGDHAQGG